MDLFRLLSLQIAEEMTIRERKRMADAIKRDTEAGGDIESGALEWDATTQRARKLGGQ